MPGSLKRLRQRFGISAPKVAVRTHVPWYLRWLLLAVLLAFSAALAAWMYDAGRQYAGSGQSAGPEELARIRQQSEVSRIELAKLHAIANAADARLAIERAAQAQLAQQIRQLEQENARLREDVAIFENMLSTEARNAQAVNIQRFKVEPDGLPGEYRYRMLLLAGSSQNRGPFHGRLELLVSVRQEGRDAMIVVPDRAAGDTATYKLAFRNFSRVEGTFRVDPKAKVGTVQVRIFEAGGTQAKATQSVTPGP